MKLLGLKDNVEVIKKFVDYPNGNELLPVGTKGTVVGFTKYRTVEILTEKNETWALPFDNLKKV